MRPLRSILAFALACALIAGASVHLDAQWGQGPRGGLPAVASYTTLDPSNALQAITLSGGNLTGTSGTCPTPVTFAVCAARGTSPTTHSGTDKVYWEITIGTGNAAAYDVFGIQTSSFVPASANNVAGFDTVYGNASITYAGNVAQTAFQQNGSGIGSMGNGCQANTGVIMAFAVNFGTSKIWENCYYSGTWHGWNNNTGGTPDAGTDGVTFTSTGTWYLGVGTNTSGDAWTLNVGATAFQQAPSATTFLAWH